MNPNKALWEKAGFTRIAATMRESGKHSVPAARRGAEVLGVDIARNLVEEGNRWHKGKALRTSGFRKAMQPSQNKSTNKQTISIPATYLRVTVFV